MKNIFSTLLFFLMVGSLRADGGVVFYLELDYEGERYYYQHAAYSGEVDPKNLTFACGREGKKRTFGEVKSSIIRDFDGNGGFIMYREYLNRIVELRQGEYIENRRFHRVSNPTTFELTDENIAKLKLISIAGVGYPATCSSGLFEEAEPWPSKFTLDFVGHTGFEDCSYELYTYRDWFLPDELETIVRDLEGFLKRLIYWSDIDRELQRLYNDGIFVTVVCSC